MKIVCTSCGGKMNLMYDGFTLESYKCNDCGNMHTQSKGFVVKDKDVKPNAHNIPRVR